MAPTRYFIRDAGLQVRPDLGCLRRPGGDEIYLRPKTFQTLLLLLEQRHRVVTKDEIAEQIWPDTAVTDDAVVQCIVEIRKVLGDDAKQSRYIRTLPKSGYRFVGEVEIELPASVSDGPESQPTGVVPAPLVAAPLDERTPTRRDVGWPLLLSLALVSLLGVGAIYFKSTRADAAAGLLDKLANDAEHRPTIAVMLLENQSRTTELDWLREGLADMLVTGLSRSKGLSVVGRQQLELLLDRVG